MLGEKSDDALTPAESADITDDVLTPAESADITDDALTPAESADTTDDALSPAESADATVGKPHIDRDCGRHGRGYPVRRPVPRSITRHDRTG